MTIAAPSSKKTIQTREDDGADVERPLAVAACFIERQFPVARISAESYKERKANYSQTLTGLGKWWGRKPLVLVRATILGLLLPSTDDPKRDREIFLALMMMDDEGLWRRKDKSIAGKRLIEELLRLPPSVQQRFLKPDAPPDEPALRRLSREEREELQRLVFERMPYSEKLEYCQRPEHLDGPSEEAWAKINAHLGTSATSLSELVDELGRRRFGHRPRVGDSFCGAGSVPFEAARIGCDAYGSDLSPVAALLTWAALNIVGGGEEVAREVQQAQQEVFEAVDRQVTEWGIEHNEQSWRADAYLYCVEVECPECHWNVPLAPSWVIGEKTHTVAELVANEATKRFDIEIHQGVSAERMQRAKLAGTVRDSRLHCPRCGPERTTEIDALRRLGAGKIPSEAYHESGLRLWENDDLVPRAGDVFQERLYCIRWVETYWTTNAAGEPVQKTRRHYRAPTTEDLKREDHVLALLRERFDEWQEKGYIPSRRIEPGAETTRLQRERGWTHWHHLFTPRQLLTLGTIAKQIWTARIAKHSIAASMLAIPKCADWNAKLSFWDSSAANEKASHTFHNQALNTHFSFSCRGFCALDSVFFLRLTSTSVPDTATIEPIDAQKIRAECDLWITDPPYADAINYHELGEFFLAWYEKPLGRLFPNWYTDSKRALAVKADNPIEFRERMVACYRRLVEYMPDDGLQVVMFTHQDAAVWADLTMILWAAGLRVTAAWCIATETDSSLKQGNYVQGTVLLVCRKRTEAEPAFLDEISHRVEAEVRRQLDSMLALDDASEPNFADADYQLAAYAAALRVLTERPIEEIDPEREITRVRPRGETSPVEQLIRNAVRIACDHLVPQGIEREMWKTLSPMERLFLKGLEVETHGEHRTGVFQELARGFGAADYADLLASTRANEARLKTAAEFGTRMLGGDGFGSSLVRQVLFAIFKIIQSEETATGLNWLKTELTDYWNGRDKILHVLDYLAKLDRVTGMDHWRQDSEAARSLAGAVRNDHI
jgi:adenine-specific DNA methylase